MNLFLTFDYELFFGSSTGTVQKCLIEPTNRLLEMARKHKVSMTFFVDIGYIIALERQFNEFSILKMDYDLVVNQIQEI